MGNENFIEDFNLSTLLNLLSVVVTSLVMISGSFSSTPRVDHEGSLMKCARSQDP